MPILTLRGQVKLTYSSQPQITLVNLFTVQPGIDSVQLMPNGHSSDI